MRLKNLRYYIRIATAVVGVSFSIQSCRDENNDIPNYTVTGEEVTLSVGITLPIMEKQTRADLDEASLNEVESLWIRTYSADTGKATSDWYKAENDEFFTGNSGVETQHPVTIKTQSGSAYIVAVANVANLGVTKDNPSERKPLSELLEAANTWTEFLNIAVVSPSTSEGVRAPIPPLPMAGCFSDIKVGGTHPEPARIDEWQKKDFQSFFIPAKKGVVDFTTTGAIHLRRLVSHINFNIKPGENVEVTVNSYQLMNAPRFSWLYERPSENEMLTNFGDLATSATDAERYYADVPQFPSQFITQHNDGSSSFDFWQAENKHSGVETLNTYSGRGLKSSDDTLFSNLTGDIWTPNNEATYVIIQCTVDYKESINVNETGEITSGGTTVYRSGEATYIVHMGYMGTDNEADKAKDFNCYRNVDYTYNVTINGLNDIRVDAFATDETFHGEEGIVVDLSNETIDIDSHYAVFNIQLTQEELENDMGFIITTYDNGRQITISDANRQAGSGNTKIIYDRDNTTVIDPKYYNWIELRPTSGPNVLAQYIPRYGGDGSTFLLTDLYTTGNVKPWEVMTEAMQSTSGWYTVFVNEYTYEPMYTGTAGYANEEWNGTGRPTWMSYVNQNPRRFYIRVTQSTSPDGNSIYARSKYGVSQQSMMTYYSDQVPTAAHDNFQAGAAIGVERVNETEGMNLRHTFAGGTSTANGRWNTAQYLNGSSTDETNLSINNANANNRPQWTNYIKDTLPLEVGAVTGDRLQNGPAIPARTIANGNPWKLPKLAPQTTGGGYTFNDPQGNNNYQIEAINACMSRNRDNNGNRIIEPDELRWYVPAMDQYLAMMLGEGSLPTPLMDYQSIPNLPRVYNKQWNTAGSVVNDACSRYMCVSSNNGKNVMWLMEGTSTSTYEELGGWGYPESHPWQIRCIRNLGANLTNVENSDKVSKPYVHDESTHRFRMSYYDLASIRTIPYYGNGTGASQMPVHTIISPYNSVYYGFEYHTEDIQIPTENKPTTADFNATYGRLQTYINNNPCGSVAGLTGTGWRIPNQEELTIMRNAGLLTNASANAAWLSCTVNYFSHNTGDGSITDTANRYYLIVTPTQGTQLTSNNLGSAGNNFYIRCIRDINN